MVSAALRFATLMAKRLVPSADQGRAAAMPGIQ